MDNLESDGANPGSERPLGNSSEQIEPTAEQLPMNPPAEAGEAVEDKEEIPAQPIERPENEQIDDQDALAGAKEQINAAYAGQEQTETEAPEQPRSEGTPASPEDKGNELEGKSEADKIFQTAMEGMTPYIKGEDREELERVLPVVKDLIVEVIKAAQEGRPVDGKELEGKTWQEVILEEVPGFLGVLLVAILSIIVAMIEAAKKTAEKIAKESNKQTSS